MHEQKNTLKQAKSIGKMLLTYNVFVHLLILIMPSQPFHMSGRSICARRDGGTMESRKQTDHETTGPKHFPTHTEQFYKLTV